MRKLQLIAPAQVNIAPAQVNIAPAQVNIAPAQVNIAPARRDNAEPRGGMIILAPRHKPGKPHINLIVFYKMRVFCKLFLLPLQTSTLERGQQKTCHYLFTWVTER